MGLRHGRRPVFMPADAAGFEARESGGQLANVADEIAYNNHDVDDGLRSGLLALDQLAVGLEFAEAVA